MEDKELEERLEEEEDPVLNELLDLLRTSHRPAELRKILWDYHDNDIARVLEFLTPEERIRMYKALGVERVSDIFSYLDDVEDYFREIGLEKSADVLEEMDADDAVDALETLPEEYREELIRHMEGEAKEDIQLITSFSGDEVGSLMTTNFICVRKGSTIKEIMKELISQSEDNDNISTIYVAEGDDTFYGAIDLPDLIRARADADPENIISTSYPTVYGRALISAEIERLRSYSEDSIPVLDEQDKILGVITATDMVEAVDDELEEDYAKLAGLTAAEDLNEPVFQSIKKRIPWLIALLGLGLVVSTVVGLFEKVVSQVALVVCFQSLILDMAGNGGTQALAVTIRVLMDENLTGKQKAGLVFKEARVGILNGLILGFTSFILVGLYICVLKGYSASIAFTISGCVGLALMLALFIAGMVGTLIPMFFHKIHVDPAVASGPLITTTNDMIAVVTYYGLSWLLLLKTLHIQDLL